MSASVPVPLRPESGMLVNNNIQTIMSLTDDDLKKNARVVSCHSSLE